MLPIQSTRPAISDCEASTCKRLCVAPPIGAGRTQSLWCVLNFVTTARPVGIRIRLGKIATRVAGGFRLLLGVRKNRLFAPWHHRRPVSDN